MIELTGFSGGWGERRALTRLDLRVQSGEALAIVGPGGSGKSTLLQLIESLIAPRTAPAERNAWWRGEALVETGSCARLGQSGLVVGDCARTLLERAGVEPAGPWRPGHGPAALDYDASLDTPLADLPAPVRRYLSFVITASSGAETLLFDEPVFELPEPWAELVSAGLTRLAVGPQTLIVVTHFLPLARQIADRVALLVDGELVEIAATNTFFSHPTSARTRNFITYGS